MRIEPLLFVVGLAAFACGSVPVQPYGRDTFVVHVDSANGAKAHRVAIDTANAHCSHLGLRMVPDAENSSVSASEMRGNVTVVQFIFRCLADSDPDNQRPTMRPTH
jgi:hypothetical protein